MYVIAVTVPIVATRSQRASKPKFAAAPLWMAAKTNFGSYATGVVELIVPSQQYFVKQLLHTSGVVVLVRSQLRDMMAHPTQVGLSG
ncbi:hypothetical protein BcDW1_7532 [Botrytis cinerea BcDW1]|uniref:Uncharacterized protein n=1 Tax=Botryotinia fuckeliana (strain BcDW1) TaxID=1290391 RepID=M7TRI8_BOTF1|nr:hypothetical protein BcDW1_7532 [Botrytis cinerea BcDW1]